MRHQKHSPKFGRRANHRTAMFRNMVTSLLRHEKIETTEAKAKELRSWVDHMITLGKRGDLHARRQALAVITDEKVVQKLFTDLAPRFKERPGGYTRITKLAPRDGDGAHMAIIELVA
jgi:large subunit ribosomal protein L17